MKRRELFMIFAGAGLANAQREADYDSSGVPQIRIDMRDLGYPPKDIIPSDESAIQALALSPAGLIYGATSGRRSHLFLLNPQHGYVQPLGVLPSVTSVHHSLVVSQDGTVYIGGSIGVDNNGDGYATYVGGRLLRYVPLDRTSGAIEIGRPLAVTDLGMPVPGEGVYAMAIDRESSVIYGLSYPNGTFFRYSILDKLFSRHGTLASAQIPGEKFEREKAIGRAITITDDGTVFTSGQDSHLYRFGRNTRELERLEAKIPGVPGREVYGRVDAWAAGQPDGYLYGGSSDGYLFRLDPKALSIENLGKPLSSSRIRGLAFSANGRLYGVGGDNGDMARLFCYDLRHGGYNILGMIDVNHRPYYSWQAYVIDAVIAGLDGTIYMGQSERKSKLYVYYP